MQSWLAVIKSTSAEKKRKILTTGMEQVQSSGSPIQKLHKAT